MVIAVTVFTPPLLARVPVCEAVGLPTGVELGLVSSKHPFELDPPTVINAEDPPVPYRP